MYPIELNKEDIDISGTEMTQPLVDSLRSIHEEAFGKASEKISKAQERYATAYDRRHNVNDLKLRRGSAVQVFMYSAKKSKYFRKGAMKSQWKPFRSYYKVHAINHKKGVVTIRT